jgi:transposase
MEVLREEVLREDDGWRIPDELWARMEPLLPSRPEHPLGGHNPRVPDRSAMDAILLVLRTGMQWHALKTTGICHPSSAYRRFREWLAAGVFHHLGQLELTAYEKLVGIDWKEAPERWAGPPPRPRGRWRQHEWRAGRSTCDLCHHSASARLA